MTKKTLYLLGILFIIAFGTFLCVKLCCSTYNKTSVLNNENKILEKSLIKSNRFSINSSDFNYSTSHNFIFKNSKAEHLSPVHDSIDFGIEQLKVILEKGESVLKISGHALASEKNSSNFANLGLARANDIKNYFISKGIPENKMELTGVVTNAIALKNDSVVGPITFDFIKNDVSKNWSLIKDEINANPLTLYFGLGEIDLTFSNDDKQRIALIVDYVSNVPNSSVEITGHTDNVGDAQLNIKFGLIRAGYVKNYLTKNGIPAYKINTFSKGSNEPIEDNTTSEGRSKNRRTNITLK
ncbi:OmpA family protein [uncultured Flavobacterium sp.]|uniref:OmpA family protein n=1 Tax=uncultured Flavobacterium sp. TaxID=165435 RepID=UPI0030CA216D